MRVFFLCLMILLLFGCQDRYRYFCQNPENFVHESCQKPKCQFTQTCPEYLVAPILEKQTNVQSTQPQQPSTEPTSNR